MGIEDIQISEELETNAPSIKYRGNEGPKSPQEIEQMMMAQLEEEYLKYVDEMIEMGREPMSMQQFMEQAMAEGQMSGGNPLPQDPTKPVNPFQPKPTGPTLPDRQMAAYGGIMGMDGRRQYGIGSSLKKGLRKLIPNELASIAVKAAPFVAPFNPLAAGLMSGIGSFDQTGRIGSSLKSGLMNYGLGQGARYLGGADFQGLQNPFTRDAFSMPTGSGGIKNLFNKSKAPTDMTEFNKLGLGGSDPSGIAGNTSNISLAGDSGTAMEAFYKGVVPKTADVVGKTQTGGILKTIKDFALDNKLLTGLAAGTLGAAALMGNMEPDEIQDMYRGEGLDIDGIRAEVQEAMADETGEKLKALRVKYPFLGRRDTKDLSQLKAEGGRIGYADAGAVLSEEQIAMMQNMIKKGMDNDTISTIANVSPKQVQNYIDSLRVNMENKAMGGRIGFAEGGGIMDLGGMEKDYRAEGGFVPIGREEKADDVPARLSVNEFVFTADAVRNAGGGDIDRGAEVMENMMKHLEQGGQVSDESQGMAGAQQMFETSERLSEVI